MWKQKLQAINRDPFPLLRELSMQSLEKKPGVYTYVAQWPICSLAWSVRHDKNARLAIGSYLEDYSNKVELVQFNHATSDFTTDSRLVFDHPYAATNLMFFPSEDTMNPDIIATSGDYLRLWQIHEDRIELKALLNSNKSSEFNSAITSFDWIECDTRRVATSSVDTTCIIWDIEKEVVDTQLVAHDKEVYDISWGGFIVFASVSGDGSVRVFKGQRKIHHNLWKSYEGQSLTEVRVEQGWPKIHGHSWDGQRQGCNIGH